MKFREINFAIIQVAKRSKLRKPKWMTFNNTSLELCSMNIPSHPPLFRPLRTFDENKVTRMIFDGIVRTAACSTGVTIGRIDRDPYTCSTPVKNIPLFIPPNLWPTRGLFYFAHVREFDEYIEVYFIASYARITAENPEYSNRRAWKNEIYNTLIRIRGESRLLLEKGFSSK